MKGKNGEVFFSFWKLTSSSSLRFLLRTVLFQNFASSLKVSNVADNVFSKFFFLFALKSSSSDDSSSLPNKSFDAEVSNWNTFYSVEKFFVRLNLKLFKIKLIEQGLTDNWQNNLYSVSAKSVILNGLELCLRLVIWLYFQFSEN